MLKFFYFDLGNVLLHFDHRRGCRQMGEVSGVPADRIWELYFESGLAWRLESGEVSDDEAFDILCRETRTRPDRQRLFAAAGDIFEVNQSMVPVVETLKRAGHRLGILSNTCSTHWTHCSAGRYPFICEAFDARVLSYRVGACKPDARIYAAATELARVKPQEIFFVDDIQQNVDGALRAGFDAVLYTTTPRLIGQLHERGVLPDAKTL